MASWHTEEEREREEEAALEFHEHWSSWCDDRLRKDDFMSPFGNIKVHKRKVFSLDYKMHNKSFKPEKKELNMWIRFSGSDMNRWFISCKHRKDPQTQLQLKERRREQSSLRTQTLSHSLMSQINDEQIWSVEPSGTLQHLQKLLTSMSLSYLMSYLMCALQRMKKQPQGSMNTLIHTHTHIYL